MKKKISFRVDHVGSLLRTPEVIENRQLWKKGKISAEKLRVIENREIAATVKRLESTGVQSITDGEFRRDYFHLDFLERLEGVTVKHSKHFSKPPVVTVTGKLKHVQNIQVDDFNYLKSVTTQTPKVCIPSPTMVHFRGGRKGIDIKSYPDLTFGIHLCRGNYKSSWFAEGGYEPVAEILFNSINVDSYFLEYDDERSGDFAPLRFVPKNKKVVLGVMSSKIGKLETKKYLSTRIKEASKYMPLKNMCISPQCGFSSTHHGNHLTHKQQWKKFERLVEVAGDIWK